jgi:leucyl-tRNA synthetase
MAFMHRKFDHEAIEKKWQEKWEQSGIYDAGDRDTAKEKEYVLVEWPYPSGNLHIGHWFAFAVVDIYVRAKRMLGRQVLFPIGFDAFGLPAENAAIKRNLDPKKWTDENIAYMKRQLQSMGNAFSWDMMTSSTDPEYYKWTQWMFTEFFKKGIAYRGTGTVNWCPGCNTVIANEQVLADGTCERCGTKVEKREMPQWLLRITDYAERLIDDLDVLDWPEHIKESQRNWIGRSRGAEIPFKLSTGYDVTVFTTRPDTLFGATYLVLAPEYEGLSTIQEHISNWSEVEMYIKTSLQKDEQDRLNANKEKTGVKLEGITATNPATAEEIPVFVADYVLGGYGTGAIMAVPAHDERDNAFAKKYNLRIRSVVSPRIPTHAAALLESKEEPGTFFFQLRDEDASYLPDKITLFGGHIEQNENLREALSRELREELELQLEIGQCVADFTYEGTNPDYYVWAAHIKDVSRDSLVLHEGKQILSLTLEEAVAHPKVMPALRDALLKVRANATINMNSGVLINSGEFDGMDSEEAKLKITEKVGGQMTNTYRLRDWSIGRQRYWGVPIPIIYDPEGKAHPISIEHLPWLLPTDVDFRPTGEAPLAKSSELKERTEKIFGEGWTPEVETMDTFVDSAWYFLRYIDNKNDEALSSMEAQQQWMPVDIYFGGAEHTTMHLLYSRFWQKALFDLGLVKDSEPYVKRINRGLVLGPDGNKMSKSKGNVIDPDEQVSRLGADTVKMYLAFMGPYGELSNYPWDMGGIAGIRRFLERVYGLSDHTQDSESEAMTRLLHKTIKKVRSDIELYKFNTAISAMMIFVNAAEKEGLSNESYRTFLKLLAPFAPHITEELYNALGETESIHLQPFPSYDEALAKEDVVTIGVQINGKIRGNITLSPDATEAEAVALAKETEGLKDRLQGDIAKVIYVPGRILNLLVQ